VILLQVVQAALRSARWPRLLLAIYLACLGLVCSFILFEVLDVDGSDFLTYTQTEAVRPADSHHEDVKRVVLAAALAFSVILGAALAAQALAGAARIEHAATPRVRRFAPTPATRMLLPRATLADAPSA
jgi:hypothetical protein